MLVNEEKKYKAYYKILRDRGYSHKAAETAAYDSLKENREEYKPRKKSIQSSIWKPSSVTRTSIRWKGF
jgi:hypothetical protein